MRRYYLPIFHKGETCADDVGELFGSAQLAVQYGARVARDVASDPDDVSQAVAVRVNRQRLGRRDVGEQCPPIHAGGLPAQGCDPHCVK
jgi:hypothetical protein